MSFDLPQTHFQISFSFEDKSFFFVVISPSGGNDDPIKALISISKSLSFIS